MHDNTASGKKIAYRKPQLISYGDLKLNTLTNRGGPQFDGGRNPFHKGPVVTGGATNIDPSYYDDTGSGDSSDVFGE